MRWNLRRVAVERDIWRPTQLLRAFEEVGFSPSLSKVAALWSSQPISVRLDDLDKICAALDCTVGDLMEAEPQERHNSDEQRARRASGDHRTDGPVRPTPRRGASRRELPPN